MTLDSSNMAVYITATSTPAPGLSSISCNATSSALDCIVAFNTFGEYDVYAEAGCAVDAAGNTNIRTYVGTVSYDTNKCTLFPCPVHSVCTNVLYVPATSAGRTCLCAYFNYIYNSNLHQVHVSRGILDRPVPTPMPAIGIHACQTPLAPTSLHRPVTAQPAARVSATRVTR